ncbi:hypothetical protein BDZ94DRAFT_1232069 [Collybia nuda]|uniref:Uncharacterized protein n=1 Tax=Collybia nuda TaxID=64659 RepID=A0A9P6CQZ1_9AGAR|nr:hypothetical protein BDZ94DRAFT_1232069 [Collybia nuda]
MTGTDEVDLLYILQAHGEQFLDAFPNVDLNTRKRRRNSSSPPNDNPHIRSSVNGDDGEEEEWFGIAESSDYGTESECCEDIEQSDDKFAGGNADVIVFRDFSSNKVPLKSKVQVKAFMSSKVSKIQQDTSSTLESQKTPIDIEDERSNAQNDALLHRLVHTKILSGSLSADLDLTPAHRQKALAGRVLELSGKAKLGRGENYVREKERNKAAKRVREGILEKQRERSKHQLEEAKNVGNYHPTLKKLFETPPATLSKKRQRGLKLGVGKYTGGLLKLSRAEINIAEGKGPGRGGYRRRRQGI